MLSNPRTETKHNNPSQRGFTLVEVVVASFVLSIAVLALFFVSARALTLSRQSVRVQGSQVLAEDVFSMVQREIYQNAIQDVPVFGAPFTACQGGNTCQASVELPINTVFETCAGQCEPVVLGDSTQFPVQDANETSAGTLTGYSRTIEMDVLSDWEMLVTVTVGWEDRGIAFERTYERTFVDWYDMGAYYEYGRVIATVIECPNESDLPNWGTSSAGPAGGIQQDTAANFIAANPQCSLSPDWRFQWGHLDWGHDPNGDPNDWANPDLFTIDESLWVDSVPLSVTGPADGSNGPGTYTYDPVTDGFREPYTNEWRSFGNTDEDGRTAIIIPDPTVSVNFALRIETKPGYIPFSYFFDDDDWRNDPTPSNVSAEMYCRDDVQNYDNFDFIRIQPGGNVYYCIAFMSPN